MRQSLTDATPQRGNARPCPWRLATLGIAVLALSACSGSFREERPPPIWFQAADANEDGTVTAAEWDQRSEDEFTALDADGDGVIEAEDLEGRFDAFDRDGDGAIEVDESLAIVSAADRDGDERVTPEEYRAFDVSRLGDDLNDDDQISRAEFFGVSRQRFAEIDRSRDQRIDRIEADALPRLTVLEF